MYENSVPAWVTYGEGRVVLNSNGTANINEAYLKDHLGNVRVVYYWAGSLKTQQVNSYYPFGMNIKGLTADGSTPSSTYKKNKYLYNGKMMQDEMGLGWLDYGARFYDGVLGRWHSVDLLAEKYPGLSPYNYCLLNPIKHVDPDGKDGDVTINRDKVTIKVPIYIYGSGANEKQAAKMQVAIMKDWNNGGRFSTYTDSKTGEKYKVNFDAQVQVYNKDNPKEGPGLFSNKNNPFSSDNFIEVGATAKDVNRSFVKGGDEGKWRGYGSDPSSHEFGHLIGLKDHYSDANGTEPAWKGNVMAEPAGQGKVEQKNIDALVAPLIDQYQKSDQYKTNGTYQYINVDYKMKIDESNPNR